MHSENNPYINLKTDSLLVSNNVLQYRVLHKAPSVTIGDRNDYDENKLTEDQLKILSDGDYGTLYITDGTNKIAEFQKLVFNNLGNKMLAFSGANDFTDQLCASVSPLSATYHSKKTKKQREKALEDFKTGSINVLCSTKALNQGLDVPDANVGIICGITSKSLSMIQRVGRLIRFQEGKVGEIYILYVQNSQEEKWLKSATKSLNNVTWLP